MSTGKSGARRVLALAIWLAVMAGCGGTSSGDHTTSETAKTTLPPPSTAVPIAGNALNRAQACQEFFRISSDYTMTDEQSATAFGDLANRTADTELANAIHRIAQLFAEHSPSVPSGDVSALCR